MKIDKEWEVDSAVETLLKAKEIQADSELMAKVKAKLEKKKKAIESIQDIKDLKNANAEEDEDEEEEDSEEKSVKVEIHFNTAGGPELTEDELIDKKDAIGVEKGLKSFKMAQNRAKGV